MSSYFFFYLMFKVAKALEVSNEFKVDNKLMLSIARKRNYQLVKLDEKRKVTFIQ